MNTDIVPLGCPELYYSYYRKKVARDYSCSPDKKPLPCLHCNRSSEIITSIEDEMIARGFGREDIDKDGHRVVVLVK